MGNRACPLCLTRVPRALVLCHSYALECPACRAQLEVSRITKIQSSAVGLVVAAGAAALAASLSETAGWSFQVIAAATGFGIGTAGLEMLFSDLTVRPKPFAAPRFPQTPA